jgi:hypothetical protein
VEELQGEVAGLQDQVELLMGKLVALKKSRDRLLSQLDSQGLELDALAAENQVGAGSWGMPPFLAALQPTWSPPCVSNV